MNKTLVGVLGIVGLLVTGCDDLECPSGLVMVEGRCLEAGPETGSRDGGTDAEDSGEASDGLSQDGADVPPRTDGGSGSDGNNSFEEAVVVTVGGEAVSAAIQTIEDKDYFQFEGQAETFVEISVIGDPERGAGGVAFVVTLLDASMTRIAIGGGSLGIQDAGIITRLPSTGTYFVVVQELGDFLDTDPAGDPSFTFELSASRMADLPFWTVEGEPNDSEATATAAPIPESGGDRFGVIGGVLHTADDVDLFRFSVSGFQEISVFTPPRGMDGDGSSASSLQIWIAQVGGNIVLRSELGRLLSHPFLPAGDYIFGVQQDASGPNDFYAASVQIHETLWASETANATNGTLAGAEAIDPSAPYFWASLGAGDVDYFSFSYSTTDSLTIDCASHQLGSGVRELRVELRDDSDTLINGETEFGEEVVARAYARSGMPSGTYYLRLSKTSQDAEVDSTWVGCSFL